MLAASGCGPALGRLAPPLAVSANNSLDDRTRPAPAADAMSPPGHAARLWTCGSIFAVLRSDRPSGSAHAAPPSDLREGSHARDLRERVRRPGGHDVGRTTGPRTWPRPSAGTAGRGRGELHGHRR